MWIKRYFDLIESQLDNSPIVRQWTVDPERRGRMQGYLRADVLLTDGSRLHFREYVDVAQGVQRITYAYQYMTHDRRLIFRYDNTEHHPQIATHPDHKHEGSEANVVPASAPSLADMLEEIGRRMGAA